MAPPLDDTPTVRELMQTYLDSSSNKNLGLTFLSTHLVELTNVSRFQGPGQAQSLEPLLVRGAAAPGPGPGPAWVLGMGKGGVFRGIPPCSKCI